MQLYTFCHFTASTNSDVCGLGPQTEDAGTGMITS